MDTLNTEKKKQGFAAISKERQKQIASLGGKAVPKEKRAFSNIALARTAAKKRHLLSEERTKP